MREKKGFTVYELAIVLIVVGLIMGLVLKATSIIEVGTLKKECAKFENMRSAFTIYYKLYKGLPGGDNITLLRNSTIAKNQLIQAGLLNESDFRVAINPAAEKEYRYYYTRCIADDGSKTLANSGEFYSYVFYPTSQKIISSTLSVPMGSVCVGVYNPATPVTDPNAFSGFVGTTPQSLRAAYELYFDDRRVDHGYGRRAHNNVSVFAQNTYDEIDFEKEVAFLQEQLKKTDFIATGGGADIPEKAGNAYFIKIY
jgi:competence protein ComGC